MWEIWLAKARLEYALEKYKKGVCCIENKHKLLNEEE